MAKCPECHQGVSAGKGGCWSCEADLLTKPSFSLWVSTICTVLLFSVPVFSSVFGVEIEFLLVFPVLVLLGVFLCVKLPSSVLNSTRKIEEGRGVLGTELRQIVSVAATIFLVFYGLELWNTLARGVVALNYTLLVASNVLFLMVATKKVSEKYSAIMLFCALVFIYLGMLLGEGLPLRDV